MLLCRQIHIKGAQHRVKVKEWTSHVSIFPVISVSIFTSDEGGGYIFVLVGLSVCLSVCLSV